MSAGELRDADEWCRLLGFTILDPDGWDRANFDFSWNERITEQEFRRRAAHSTMRLWKGWTESYG